jgi:hypothetical protein
MPADKLENFSIFFLKGNGDIKDRSIQRWHLASDLFASGVYASGYFDSIKIDGPTASGYVLTTDSEGWGSWQKILIDFISLADTPSSYLGYAASGVRVNALENGLEFYPIQ